MELLEKLCSLRATSGDEGEMTRFILDYVEKNSKNWKRAPEVFSGEGFQDCIILLFGKNPRTAVYAHMDSIGYTVGYQGELIRIGGPASKDGIQLVGRDSRGEIDCELMILEEDGGGKRLQYIFDRDIDRGTPLSFKPHFRDGGGYVQSPYLDNRLGVWNALRLAEDMLEGVIVFSCYEEHGGGTVGYLALFLLEKYGIKQALISDITWVTPGVKHGEGVAISMRDSGIPRRTFLNRVLKIASESGVKYQLEVESAGGSDGTALQRSSLPIDWLFIGAPEDHVHSPDEKVHKGDILSMQEMYSVLMEKL